MAKKQLKKCGWCTKEIKENEACFQIWENNKLIVQLCEKCDKGKYMDERIRKILGSK